MKIRALALVVLCGCASTQQTAATPQAAEQNPKAELESKIQRELGPLQKARFTSTAVAVVATPSSSK